MKAVIAILFLAISASGQTPYCPIPAGLTAGAAAPVYTTISSVVYSGGGGTSGSINTATANIITITVASFSGGSGSITVTDSKGNTYTRRAKQIDAGGLGADISEYDCISPTVGAGHTFTVTGGGFFISFVAHAYLKSNGTPIFDAIATFNSTSVSGSSYTMSAGTVTASVGGELFVIGGNLAKASSAPTVDNSFITPAPNFTGLVGGVNYGTSESYKLSGSSGNNTANFTFNPQGGASATAFIACYK